MRDILPIAVFEQTQISNWRTPNLGLSAYDICDEIASYRSQLDREPIKASQILDASFILGVNSKLTKLLDGCEEPEFKNIDAWQSFIDEMTAEFDITEIPFRESGSYVISLLFSTHLKTLRLLTAWLVVDALAKAINQPKLSISQTGLGLLIKDLSFSGPPIFDAEDMRSEFPERYR